MRNRRGPQSNGCIMKPIWLLLERAELHQAAGKRRTFNEKREPVFKGRGEGGGDMAKQLEFLFDYGSPFSYLANIQLPGFAKRNGATIVYRPILLGAVLKATGNSSPMTVPAKARYFADDMRRWAARYGVMLKLNPHPFMGNTLPLMRGAIAAQRLGVFAAYHDAIYRAAWAEGLDLGERVVLTGLLQRAGVNAVDVIVASERQDVKEELRRNTDEAVARGTFGAPTFFVGNEMFWGNDRFDFVEEALRRQK